MSAENDLSERLDHALRAITPKSAPVEEAMLRGKAIRTRRRITAVLSVAAVAAIGIGAVPALRHPQTATRPATQPAVTVRPPGPESPPGLIASGLISGMPWQAVVYRPGTHSAGRSQQCFAALGAAFGAGPGGVLGCAPVSDLDSTTAPINFLGTSCATAQAELGRVRSDVAYAVVRLADGTMFTLHPVKAYGERYIAFAAPVNEGIASITAYSRTGPIATAYPFNSSQGPAFIGTWLGVGQRIPAPVTKLVASGSADGEPWSVTAHRGPWGSCLVDVDGRTFCVPVTSSLGTSILGSTSGSPTLVYGSAAAEVDHVVIALSDGKTIRAQTVLVGNQRFFAFATGSGQSARHWTAYDHSGGVVASGRVTLGS